MKIIKDETGASRLSMGREDMGELFVILEMARQETQENIKRFLGQDTFLLVIWERRLKFIEEAEDTIKSIPTIYRGE